MRKILFLAVFILLAAVNTSFASNSAAAITERVPAVMVMMGQIKEVNEKSVLVEANDSKMGKVQANISQETYIYNNEKREFVNVSDLKKGQKVVLYHSPMMTRSIPPQSPAFAIIIGSGEQLAKYYRVDEVYESNKGLKFLTQNGGLIVSAQMEKNIKAKDELLVWHGPVAMSMPGQTTASNIVNLSNMKKEVVTMHLNAGVIAVNGKEIQITTGKATNDAYQVIKKGKTYLVPLMPIAKALDIQATFEQGKNVVILDDGGEFAIISLDDKKCSFDGEQIELSSAPKMIKGEIMVPIDLFKNALNINFELLNTPI